MELSFAEYMKQYNQYKKMTDPEYIKRREIENKRYELLCRTHREEEKRDLWAIRFNQFLKDNYPEDEQKRKDSLNKAMDEKLSKHYGKINKIYKSITRERTKEIVNKLDYMIHTYYNHFKLNAKEKKKNDNALISTRILNNKNFPEASTIATIYTVYGAICLMHRYYKNNPNSIFEWHLLSNFYSAATISTGDVKKGIGCDDKEIEDAYNFLMNLPNEEIEQRINNNIVDGKPLDTQSPYYRKNQ